MMATHTVDWLKPLIGHFEITAVKPISFTAAARGKIKTTWQYVQEESADKEYVWSAKQLTLKNKGINTAAEA